jgi:hypothetical protein
MPINWDFLHEYAKNQQVQQAARRKLRLPNSLCSKELAIFPKSPAHRTGGSNQLGFGTGPSIQRKICKTFWFLHENIRIKNQYITAKLFVKCFLQIFVSPGQLRKQCVNIPKFTEAQVVMYEIIYNTAQNSSISS